MARSTAVANCWDIVRATSRRMMSPATMLLTPPDGFCSAVNRPRRTTSTISSGTTALERSCANRQNRVVSSTLSNSGRPITAHPIAQVFPRGRHVVEGRPHVSALDGFDVWPPRGGLCNKSRGNNKNSFHALVAARSSLAARALSASTSANHGCRGDSS